MSNNMNNLPIELKREIIHSIGCLVLAIEYNCGDKVYNPHYNTWSWASKEGKLSVIEWLHKTNKDGCSCWAMNFASQKGHLDIVKFLHKYRNEKHDERALNLAVIYNHLDVVKFLCENQYAGDEDTAYEIAYYHDHEDIMKYLHRRKISLYVN